MSVICSQFCDFSLKRCGFVPRKLSLKKMHRRQRRPGTVTPLRPQSLSPLDSIKPLCPMGLLYPMNSLGSMESLGLREPLSSIEPSSPVGSPSHIKNRFIRSTRSNVAIWSNGTHKSNDTTEINGHTVLHDIKLGTGTFRSNGKAGSIELLALCLKREP